MRHYLFVIYSLFVLLTFSACDKDEEKMIDLEDMVMEEEDLLEEQRGSEPIFSPQEVIVKEVPEIQPSEHQR